MAISPQLNFVVVASGTVPSDRAAWAHLDHPILGPIGILSIYTPNGSTKRRHFWHELVDTLDTQRRWIIGGDFNMVEASTDRKGGLAKWLKEEKREDGIGCCVN